MKKENVIYQITCSLCGFKFNKDDYHCRGCALNKNCKVICCPHCGYRMVDDSGVRAQYDRIRRFAQWLKRKILRMKSWN